MRFRACFVRLALVVSLFACLAAGQQPDLTLDQQEEFLRSAKIIKGVRWSKGVTGIYRLTLTDGQLTQDAAFQAIDERKPLMEFATGRREMNFRDSWHFNIAAYELSKVLGLVHMMPAHVERRYAGKTGSLCWWLPAKLDEEKRIKEKIEPPDPAAWNRQMYAMRVFSELVYDTDRNLGNVMISEDWKLWMIDFSRGFRTHKDLNQPANLVRCDRSLVEKLKALTLEDVRKAVGNHLTKSECEALIARRDKIVEHFAKLVAQKGEDAVLY